MNEISAPYEKTEEEVAVSSEVKTDIENIKDKLNKIDRNSLDNEAYSRVEACINILNNEEVFEILEKRSLSDVDIYKLKSLYQNEIVDGCLVGQLYGMKGGSVERIEPFIKNNIDVFLANMSYVDNVLLNNSSYSFHSNFFKTNIFNYKQESYYQVVRSYRKSIDLVNNVLDWMSLEVSGE